MTRDEAIEAAEKLLMQRGQLLNGHLLRLVDADKDLFRDVREQLIASGVAEDRSGVGLAFVGRAVNVYENAGVGTETATGEESAATSSYGTSTVDIPDVAEWWLMKAGVVSGPFDLASLAEMRRRGEMTTGSVIRRGTDGLWQQPEQVAHLAESAPTKSEPTDSFRLRRRLFGDIRTALEESNRRTQSRQMSALRVARANSRDEKVAEVTSDSAEEISATEPILADADVDTESSSTDPQSAQFTPPAKLWSLESQRQPGRFLRAWGIVADLVGGTQRLKWMLVIGIAIAGFTYWWKQPPPASTIYDEFTACRTAILKLQDRRAKRSEWAPVVERYRPRVESILGRLSPQATDRNPVQKALYLAGAQGLVPLLENPMDPTTAERMFDQHMSTARSLLDHR